MIEALSLIVLSASDPDQGAGAAKYLQYILPGIFGGGLLGAIGLFIRYRPEATSAAVIQANTAMQGMGEFIEDLKEDRKDLQEQLNLAQEATRELTAKVGELTSQVSQLREEVQKWRTMAEELQAGRDPSNNEGPTS